MNPRAVRIVVIAACVTLSPFVLVGVLAALGWSAEGAEEEEPRICPELVERVIPVTHKGVRYENVLVIGEVPVPCEKPPSTARVETVLNPTDRSQVDMDREAVDGEGVR